MNRLVNIVVCKLKSFGFASCTAFKSKMEVKHFHITHAHYFDVIFSRFYQKIVMELPGIAHLISEIIGGGLGHGEPSLPCKYHAEPHYSRFQLACDIIQKGITHQKNTLCRVQHEGDRR